ncbi:heterokaryon incompatibility protein-domain-containing protein [Paraphoma chrysanthemicola]|uniref:Heterokaryon incompatibility protein-domain-containing protein n=1 Tax=Paraphoma chrysanthemicola TaxID=798071 RepID=A0A8K0VTE9_9PLEO|nr:heterokaryon incompatibility protein-domain-containing protein [Paraphoma chrysanthemicola]
MFKNDYGRWLSTRKRMAHQCRVHFLAKMWVRSKRLRDLKAFHMRWILRRAARRQRPLDDGEIRLLQLRPGNALSTIICDFLYVDLRFANDYAALSYTWGTAAPSVPILLHGKVTLVSENLFLALLHLRKRQVTLIWVDALCINQEDLAERARQVSHMDQVYKRASLVWVWLGDGDAFSDLAFGEIHHLAQRRDWDGAVPQRVLEEELAQNPQGWGAISELLYRPWFRRMWIIQEVLCARRGTMICGQDTIDMDLFFQVIYSLCKANMLKAVLSLHQNRHELSGGPLAAVSDQLEFFVTAKFDTTDIFAQKEFKKTLLSFMAGTRRAEATNPLDKIYGVFSLASDARSLAYWHSSEGERVWLPFQIDYTLAKEDLFIKITKAILCTSGSLDILRFSKYEPHCERNLPSWVADWATPTSSTAPHYFPLVSIDETENRSWRSMPEACKDPKERLIKTAISHQITRHCRPHVEFGHQNTLTIKGMHLDTIATLSLNTFPQDAALSYFDPDGADVTGTIAKWHRHLEALKLWSEECLQHAQTCHPYPNGESIASALWSTLNGHASRAEDQVPDSCVALPRAIENVQLAAGAVEKQMQSEHVDALSDVLSSVALSTLLECLARLPKMSATCSGQKFATTWGRYMGLMPDGAMVGDWICVVYGCETPVVLRARENGCFVLIGHGELRGFDFDDAVVEATTRRKRAAKDVRKKKGFTTWDEAGRAYYTFLKETREFILM